MVTHDRLMRIFFERLSTSGTDQWMVRFRKFLQTAQITIAPNNCVYQEFARNKKEGKVLDQTSDSRTDRRT